MTSHLGGSITVTSIPTGRTALTRRVILEDQSQSLQYHLAEECLQDVSSRRINHTHFNTNWQDSAHKTCHLGGSITLTSIPTGRTVLTRRVIWEDQSQSLQCQLAGQCSQDVSSGRINRSRFNTNWQDSAHKTCHLGGSITVTSIPTGRTVLTRRVISEDQSQSLQYQLAGQYSQDRSSGRINHSHFNTNWQDSARKTCHLGGSITVTSIPTGRTVLTRQVIWEDQSQSFQYQLAGQCSQDVSSGRINHSHFNTNWQDSAHKTCHLGVSITVISIPTGRTVLTRCVIRKDQSKSLQYQLAGQCSQDVSSGRTNHSHFNTNWQDSAHKTCHLGGSITVTSIPTGWTVLTRRVIWEDQSQSLQYQLAGQCSQDVSSRRINHSHCITNWQDSAHKTCHLGGSITVTSIPTGRTVLTRRVIWEDHSQSLQYQLAGQCSQDGSSGRINHSHFNTKWQDSAHKTCRLGGSIAVTSIPTGRTVLTRRVIWEDQAQSLQYQLAGQCSQDVSSGRINHSHFNTVSILGFENCQSFFPHKFPWQDSAHKRCHLGGSISLTMLIGTTLAQLSKQLRNITYRQLFKINTPYCHACL